MSKVKAVTKYHAADGSNHDSEADALAHNEFKEAEDAFEQAQKRYNHVLAKRHKTADGQPFTLSGSYYVVSEGHSDALVSQIYVHSWNTTFHVDEHGRAFIMVPNQNERPGERHMIQLENVYGKERPARLRQIEAKKQRLGWMQDDIAKLEKDWTR